MINLKWVLSNCACYNTPLLLYAPLSPIIFCSKKSFFASWLPICKSVMQQSNALLFGFHSHEEKEDCKADTYQAKQKCMFRVPRPTLAQTPDTNILFILLFCFWKTKTYKYTE